jgi:hypothetical protein
MALARLGTAPDIVVRRDRQGTTELQSIVPKISLS